MVLLEPVVVKVKAVLWWLMAACLALALRFGCWCFDAGVGVLLMVRSLWLLVWHIVLE